MLKTTVDFANLLFAALLVGAMFGVWLSFNPAGQSASAYVLRQQQGIRTLHPALPILGFVTIVLTLAATEFAYEDGPRSVFLLGAAACFIASGMITRFLNQPINAIVIHWSAEAPPSNWTALRDAWWRWHRVRTVIGIVGLCACISAALMR
jgi:uncharacterized membrane protein